MLLVTFFIAIRLKTTVLMERYKAKSVVLLNSPKIGTNFPSDPIDAILVDPSFMETKNVMKEALSVILTIDAASTVLFNRTTPRRSHIRRTQIIFNFLVTFMNKI